MKLDTIADIANLFKSNPDWVFECEDSWTGEMIRIKSIEVEDGHIRMIKGEGIRSSIRAAQKAHVRGNVIGTECIDLVTVLRPVSFEDDAKMSTVTELLKGIDVSYFAEGAWANGDDYDDTLLPLFGKAIFAFGIESQMNGCVTYDEWARKMRASLEE